MTHKYNAKPVWYNPKNDTAYGAVAIGAKEAREQGYLYFPSTLEYEVFRQTRAFFALSRLRYSIETQHTIEILPKVETIRAITWCVDIKVTYYSAKHTDITGVLYVEAKGVETDDYKLKMNLLARFKPEILYDVCVMRNPRLVDAILRNRLERKHT